MHPQGLEFLICDVRGDKFEKLILQRENYNFSFFINKRIEDMDELKNYTGGYGSDKNYLDFYDDGVTVNYDYFPYFLAEQIYQTPTGLENPEELVIRPLYTTYNEPFYTSTNNLFFVRG